MLAIASDHGGFALKQEIMAHLRATGVEFEDLGTYSEESCDYPVYAEKLGKAVAAGDYEKGILICGFDGISSGVQAVVDGTISCTVAQDPYNMGYQCVKSLVDAIEGKELPEFIDTGCNVITPENAAEYLAKLKELVP